MRRLFMLLAAFVAVTLAASTVMASAFPTSIALADGWRPEGIAVGRGLTAYVGSLSDGGIARVDLRTGARDDDFVASATGPAVGLEYEKGAHRLWVAGGPSGEVRVYDAGSGAHLGTFGFSAGFVNDLVVTRDAVYATDSAIQQLLVVPLGPDGALPDPGDAFAIPITGDLVYEAGFNANGIEATGGWLIVVQSNTGELFRVNPDTGASSQLLPAGSMTNADGLLLVGHTLYAVENVDNLISAWRIQGGAVGPLGTIEESDLPAGADLDVPTTIAFAAGSLWAVNARFMTPPTADTPYWITRVPR
jgi:hypothetical protein